MDIGQVLVSIGPVFIGIQVILILPIIIQDAFEHVRGPDSFTAPIPFNPSDVEGYFQKYRIMLWYFTVKTNKNL
jgi:hypothetical protein